MEEPRKVRRDQVKQCRGKRRFTEERALTECYQREDEAEATFKLDTGI